MMRTIILLCSVLVLTASALERGVIKDLSGFPSHRAVKLSWSYVGDRNSLIGFQVQYTEMGNWRPRYHKRVLTLNHAQMSGGDMIFTDDNVHFQAVIQHLRAATVYLLSVSPMVTLPAPLRNGFKHDFGFGQNRNSKDLNNWIEVATLPFTAKVINCAEREAVVRVTTGRHFGGKIGVTDVNKKSCYIIGDGSNIGDTMNLTINFEKCGAVKKGMSILSTIVVQENSVVMTGSDRQFTVNCSYAPTFLVVSASVNMPVGKEYDETHDSNNVISDQLQNPVKYHGDSIRESRILADQDALSSSRTNFENMRNQKLGSHAGQILIVSFFIIASVLGLLGALYWVMVYSKKLQQKKTELPDGTDKNHIVVLKKDSAAASTGVLTTDCSDVSLVSIKNISEA